MRRQCVILNVCETISDTLDGLYVPDLIYQVASRLADGKVLFGPLNSHTKFECILDAPKLYPYDVYRS